MLPMGMVGILLISLLTNVTHGQWRIAGGVYPYLTESNIT
jgi:hypothetical protein